MLPGLALPSVVRQAPDHLALRKTTTLVLAGQPLSTPPIAQEYFEPGVNVKMNRRSKPKTNYTLPSDMPTYPMGFVPTNKASGPETGEEPPLIVVKEAKPADLMDVFARIEAEEKAIAALPKYGVDMGTMVVREYEDVKRMALLEKRVDSLMRDGYTENEAVSAVEVVRMEEAVKKAKEPPKPLPVEEAIQEALGVATAAVTQRRRVRKSTAQLAEETGVPIEELQEGLAIEKRAKRTSKLMAAGIPVEVAMPMAHSTTSKSKEEFRRAIMAGMAKKKQGE